MLINSPQTVPQYLHVAAVHIGCNKEQILYTGNVMLHDCQLFAVGYRETNGTLKRT
jgi:hypothetical protein